MLYRKNTRALTFENFNHALTFENFDQTLHIRGAHWFFDSCDLRSFKGIAVVTVCVCIYRSVCMRISTIDSCDLGSFKGIAVLLWLFKGITV